MLHTRSARLLTRPRLAVASSRRRRGLHRGDAPRAAECEGYPALAIGTPATKPCCLLLVFRMHHLPAPRAIVSRVARRSLAVPLVLFAHESNLRAQGPRQTDANVCVRDISKAGVVSFQMQCSPSRSEVRLPLARPPGRRRLHRLWHAGE